MAEYKYAVGHVFGEWTLTARLGRNRMQVTCSCGAVSETALSNLSQGRSTMCVACSRKLTAVRRTSGYSEAWQQSSMHNLFMQNAKKRSLPFDLTVESAWRLSQSDCFYCGLPPSQTFKRTHGSVTYSGIDRIDAGIGYVEGNVRPACWSCNCAKNVMTENDFYRWLERAFNFGRMRDRY